MKVLMQFFTAMHVFFYRLSGGKLGGRMGAGKILLLDSIGRKSGRTRTNPVMYFRDGASYVVAVSAGGSPHNPGWFYNLKDARNTSIQVNEQKLAVSIEVASPVKREELWSRLVSEMPQFKGYETRTTRKIPMLILKPE